MSSVADLVTVNILPGDTYWSNYVTGIKFGNVENEEWKMDSIYSFIDSGSSYITIPVVYWSWFITHLASFAPSGFVQYSSYL